MFTETEIGNIAPSNSEIYTVVSGLVHDETDYRALIDIDDARESLSLNIFYRNLVTMVKIVENEIKKREAASTQISTI